MMRHCLGHDWSKIWFPNSCKEPLLWLLIIIYCLLLEISTVLNLKANWFQLYWSTLDLLDIFKQSLLAQFRKSYEAAGLKTSLLVRRGKFPQKLRNRMGSVATTKASRITKWILKIFLLFNFRAIWLAK